MLKFVLDFIRNTLILLPLISRFLVVASSQRIQVFLVPHVLLFLLNVQRAKILLELAFSDAMLVFSVLKRYLCFFLELGELVKVLEDQML